MKKLIIIFLLTPSLFFSQTKDELDLCMAIQANSFSTNTEAENALDRILDVIGASKNFVLTPCDKISNAVATAYKGTRYILYDREFMNLISMNTNDWSNLFIFAHEVGHHINGHSIDLLLYTNDVVDAPSLEKSRQQELEADEFAAFILAKLGANLSQLNNVITLISDNSDDSYSTHPKREKRLASVKTGFDKGYVEPLKIITYKKKNTNTISNDYSKWKKEEINSLEYRKEGLESKYLNDPFFIKKLELNEPSKKIWSKVKGKNINSDWNPNYLIEYLVRKQRFLRSGGNYGRYYSDNYWYRKGNYPFFKFELRIKIPDVNIEEFANSNEIFFDKDIDRFVFDDYINASVIIDNNIYFDDYKFYLTVRQSFETIDKKNLIFGYFPSNGKEFSNATEDLCISIIKESDPDDFDSYKSDLKFISALKNGSRLFIKLHPNTEKGMRNLDIGGQVFEFSLSGSSKALAD